MRGARVSDRELPLPVTRAAWESSPVANWKMTRADRPSGAQIPPRVSDLLRVPPGPVDLAAIATGDTPGFTGSGKADGKAAIHRLAPRLADLQEQLYAEGHTNGQRSLLLVLQGMDTAGKGGTVGHVLGLMNPMGVQYHAFKKPTVEEREHHFLWRVKRRLPPPGIVGVFDRSHYEDVVVVRVHELVPADQWSCRYDVINRFEEKLAASSAIVKCFLHISKEQQQKRLLARLDDPAKHWKYDPADLAERAYWDDYQQAYSVALRECNTEAAPWYVVPADHKWYRNWAITNILADRLAEMALAWPTPGGWNLEEQRAQLAADQ